MFPNAYSVLQTFKVLMRIVENFPKLAAAEFPGIVKFTMLNCHFHGYLVQCLDVIILLSITISCEALA